MFLNKLLKPYFTNLDVSEKQSAQLNQYLELLAKWNHKINLTGIKNKEDFFPKLVLDALAPFSIDTFSISGKGIDIGSGSGVPGVIFAIFFPSLEVHSIDKREKKIVFQEIVKSETHLRNYFPYAGDIYDYANEIGVSGSFDFVLSRAWSQLPQILHISSLLLKEKGYVIAWKGEKWEEELNLVERSLLDTFQITENQQYHFKNTSTGGRVLVFQKK